MDHWIPKCVQMSFNHVYFRESSCQSLCMGDRIVPRRDNQVCPWSIPPGISLLFPLCQANRERARLDFQKSSLFRSWGRKSAPDLATLQRKTSSKRSSASSLSSLPSGLAFRSFLGEIWLLARGISFCGSLSKMFHPNESCSNFL